MTDPDAVKKLPWQLLHNDEIWTMDPDPHGETTFVATVENPEYPSDSALGEYIVAMHNAQIDKIENALAANHFDYEKLVAELREAP